MAVATKAAAFVASAPSFAAFRALQVSSSAPSEGARLIGTHNGTFHCDEALAVSMLKLLPRFAAHDVLRSRDEAQLARCEVVVDVGGAFDAEKLRFDHHQRGFEQVFDDKRSTKLSSAGLVYKCALGQKIWRWRGRLTWLWGQQALWEGDH